MVKQEQSRDDEPARPTSRRPGRDGDKKHRTAQSPDKPGRGDPSPGSTKKDKAAPGLNNAEHSAAQVTAHQAETIRKALFPSLMAAALGLDKLFASPAYKLFLEQLIRDAGKPTDPVEVMILEQLALAHFRLGQLHGSAGRAGKAEVAKIYNAAAARLLGEFRRTALALRTYRTGVPEGKPAPALKIRSAS